MIRFVTIIGARPQFIKAAAVSRAIATHFSNEVKEVIVHTGQHYDPEMSEVFFEEMKIPRPDYNLQIGSGSHGAQTAAMLSGIEEILLKEKPDAVVLFGDTNSTLAGALAASKHYLNVAHIEAGLRSFNKHMPEEINRILCDHVSSFLFCPTRTAVDNLINEGFSPEFTPTPDMDHPRVYHCGDVMFDNTLFFADYAREKVDVLKRQGLGAGKFILSTLHRNNNTDDPQRLGAIFRALLSIADLSGGPVVLPLHPRTRKMLETHPDRDLISAVEAGTRVRLIPPVSFLEMTALEDACSLVITDSGGVQKEAYFLKKPCIVMRSETEWVELVEQGAAVLADADEARIVNAWKVLSARQDLQFPEIFGDGSAARFIVGELVKSLNK